jgi:hypothetical protein
MLEGSTHSCFLILLKLTDSCAALPHTDPLGMGYGSWDTDETILAIQHLKGLSHSQAQVEHTCNPSCLGG